jgi:hypothetical protein
MIINNSFIRNDSLNKKNRTLTPIKIDYNKIIQRKLFILNKSINLNKINENYMNRPIIDFKPKMELYEFKHEKLINPSKLKYVVPICQPACHKFKKIISLKKKNNKNNFLNSYSNNDSEFENYMKEMKQIKNKKLISLKKKKNSFI